MTTDLVTGQRTFCIGVSGLGTLGLTEAPTDIIFRDTSGGDMRCSYFKIEAVAQNSIKSAVIAEVSGIPKAGNAQLNALSALAAAGNASGICGVGVLCGSGGVASAEWHGSNGQVATGVRLYTTTDFTNGISVMVTYGNLFPLNSLRLEQSYDAGV